MSAEDCPLQLIRPEAGEDYQKGNLCIKFEIPIDPNEPDVKSNIQFKKLNFDNPEDVMAHVQNFDSLVADLETPEGGPRFRLFRLCLAPNAKRT